MNALFVLWVIAVGLTFGVGTIFGIAWLVFSKWCAPQPEGPDPTAALREIDRIGRQAEIRMMTEVARRSAGFRTPAGRASVGRPEDIIEGSVVE